MKKVFTLLSVIGIFSLITFTGCEDTLGTGDKINKDEFGKLLLTITDSPFPVDMIDSAMVTIVKVEIRDADLADVDSVYPYIVLMEDTSITFNLLELRNGVKAEMIETDLPEGNYDLVRLYVEKASLTVKDGNTYKLKVPSGASTGIKVFVEPVVQLRGGMLTELMLDFSLEKSFVLKGNLKSPIDIKGFNFKPVVHAVNMVTAGGITGMVSDTASNPVGYAEVWLEDDTVVATAFSDTLGFYGFAGVKAGTYDIFATAENFDTVSFMDLEVVAGNLVQQNFVLTPKDTATTE